MPESRKNMMPGLFHGFVCLLLLILFGIIPGSICPASVIALMLFAFGIGRKSNAAEEEDPSPLPWIMLLYGMSIFLGAILNLGFLIFISRGK